MAFRFKSSPYEDIIDLPHHVSEDHPSMPLSDRAAQFSPFAALTGFGAAIEEAARRTEPRRELADEEKALLDLRLRSLAERIGDRPQAAVTYFLPDARKEGGACVTAIGRLKKLDEISRELVFTDGTRIFFDDIYDIDDGLPDPL